MYFCAWNQYLIWCHCSLHVVLLVFPFTHKTLIDPLKSTPKAALFLIKFQLLILVLLYPFLIVFYCNSLVYVHFLCYFAIHSYTYSTFCWSFCSNERSTLFVQQIDWFIWDAHFKYRFCLSFSIWLHSFPHINYKKKNSTLTTIETALHWLVLDWIQMSFVWHYVPLNISIGFFFFFFQFKWALFTPIPLRMFS